MAEATVLPAYPTEIPAETWGILLSALQGNFGTIPHTLHVAYVCEGFALGKFAADPIVSKQGVTAGPDAMAVLEALAGGKQMSWLSVAWHQVVALIQNLIAKLLVQSTA